MADPKHWDASELETVRTLAAIRGIGRLGWDVLGQALLVEFEIRNDQGKSLTIPVSMSYETAAELQSRLDLALTEKEGEAGSAQ